MCMFDCLRISLFLSVVFCCCLMANKDVHIGRYQHEHTDCMYCTGNWSMGSDNFDISYCAQKKVVCAVPYYDNDNEREFIQRVVINKSRTR